jgi:hypothetical protein
MSILTMDEVFNVALYEFLHLELVKVIKELSDDI